MYTLLSCSNNISIFQIFLIAWLFSILLSQLLVKVAKCATFKYKTIQCGLCRIQIKQKHESKYDMVMGLREIYQNKYDSRILRFVVGVRGDVRTEIKSGFLFEDPFLLEGALGYMAAGGSTSLSIPASGIQSCTFSFSKHYLFVIVRTHNIKINIDATRCPITK